MRGKKDVSDVMSDEKRAPANSGFFGMRGKKAPLVNIAIVFSYKPNKIFYFSQLAFSEQEVKKVHSNSVVNLLAFEEKRFQMDR